MQVLLSRYAPDAFFRDSDLGTAWRGEDLGDVVEIEVRAEGFLHFFLLGRGSRFFVHACGVHGSGAATYTPGYAEVEKAAALDFAEVEMVEGEDHTIVIHSAIGWNGPE